MRLYHDPIHSGSCLDRIRRAFTAGAKRGKVACAILALVFAAACQDQEIEAQAEAASAMAMLEQNRFAEARMAINRALILKDDVPDYHIARGRIEFAAGAVSAAYDAYFDALALDPSNLEALQAVSQLGLQTGNINASLRATDTLILLNPGDTTALITRGVHALISSRLDEADDYAARALAVNSYSDEAMILRSRVLYLRGKNEAALELLENRSREGEDSAGIHLMRLELYRAQRNPKGMEIQFGALRATDQISWQLAVDEANFLFKLGRRNAALDLTVDLLASDELTPEALRSVVELWRLWAITDLSDEAVVTLSTKGSQSVRYDVALFLARQSALDHAVELSQSLDGNGRDALAAFIALRSGRTAEAERLASRVLGADKTHCLGLEVQARIRLSRGKLREALTDAQQVTIQCPNEVAGWIIAASAYSEMGDPHNARRVFRQGAEANPQDLGYLIEHTRWLRRQDRQREAIAVARRLTRDAPAMIQGWEHYRELCGVAADPCVADAERGLADARTRYWIDYKPGESPPPGLFGRLKDI